VAVGSEDQAESSDSKTEKKPKRTSEDNEKHEKSTLYVPKYVENQQK
jgi:hypothetical protein